MSSKFDKFLRVWCNPLLILIVFIAFEIYTIQIYLNIGGSSDDARKLSAEATITLLATFVGIFVPLQVNRNWDSEKDRRTLAFTLGLFWHELLYNEFILKEILGNLKVEQLDTFTGEAFEGALHSLKAKVDSLNGLGEMLSSSSFMASQNSGAIKTLKNDDLFNNIIEVYDNIKDIKYKLKILQGNTTKNSYVFKNTNMPFLEPLTENQIRSMIKRDFEETNLQANESLQKIEVTLKSIDIELKKLGVDMDTALSPLS